MTEHKTDMCASMVDIVASILDMASTTCGGGEGFLLEQVRVASEMLRTLARILREDAE